jgi:hypothetical protein
MQNNKKSVVEVSTLVMPMMVTKNVVNSLFPHKGYGPGHLMYPKPCQLLVSLSPHLKEEVFPS